MEYLAVYYNAKTASVEANTHKEAFEKADELHPDWGVLTVREREDVTGMKKFRVNYSQVTYGYVEVYAEDEDEIDEIDVFDEDSDRFISSQDGESGDITILSVEEIE